MLVGNKGTNTSLFNLSLISERVMLKRGQYSMSTSFRTQFLTHFSSSFSFANNSLGNE